MNACRHMERCKGFEKRYMGNNGGITPFLYDVYRCWFKEAIEIAYEEDESIVFVKNATVVSFMDDLKAIEAEFVPGYEFKPNTVADDDEYTMGDVIYDASQGCSHRCSAFPECVGFVTSPVEFKCWLKSALPSITDYNSDEDHKISHVYVKNPVQ